MRVVVYGHLLPNGVRANAKLLERRFSGSSAGWSVRVSEEHPLTAPRFPGRRGSLSPGRAGFILLFLFSIAPLAFTFELQSPEHMVVGQTYDNQMLVPTNQVLALAGERVQFSGWP